MKNLLYLAVITVGFLVACQPKTAEVNKQQIADTITNIESQWLLANQARDVEKCMSYYAADAVVMNQGVPLIKGIDAIRVAAKANFADTSMLWGTFAWKTEHVDVASSGDMAIVRGSYSIKYKTPESIIDLNGKGIDVFKRMNGEWKATISIYNNDK